MGLCCRSWSRTREGNRWQRKQKQTHKNEMGEKQKREDKSAESEGKGRQWKKPRDETKKSNHFNITRKRHMTKWFFWSHYFFNRREEKSSWELSPKSLACCRNPVLYEVSVGLGTSLEKVKFYSKSLWGEGEEGKKRQGRENQYDSNTREHVQWCADVHTSTLVVGVSLNPLPLRPWENLQDWK